MSYQGDVNVGNIAGNGNVVGHNNRFTVNNTYVQRGRSGGEVVGVETTVGMTAARYLALGCW